MHHATLRLLFSRLSPILLLVVALPRPALASDFFISVGGNQITSQSPISDSFSDAFTTATARAGSDLGILLTARAQPAGFGGRNINDAQALAIATYDDVVITGPTPTVETTLRLPYHGIFSVQREVWSEVGTTGGPFFESNSGQEASFLAIFQGQLSQTRVFFNPLQQILEISDPNAVVSQRTLFGDVPRLLSLSNSQGVFAGVGGSEIFVLTGSIVFTADVPTGQPLFLELELFGRMNASSHGFAIASGGVDILNSFGVPRGVPVFDLPAGYTANSPSLGMVDNHVAVPEPSTVVLLAIGLFTLGAWRRRSNA